MQSGQQETGLLNVNYIKLQVVTLHVRNLTKLEETSVFKRLLWKAFPKLLSMNNANEH